MPGVREAVAAQAQPIALALGGRAGGRLAGRLAGAVSRMTLTRMIRRLSEAAVETPRVLGVDDFALRRGCVYGSVLIDITTGRPVELLVDRTADTLAAWLRAHPGVEIVCRDRAGACAEGITRGAPEAIQVADRWHVWRNLGDAVERAVARHCRHLHVLTENAPGARGAARPADVPVPRRQDRPDRCPTRQRHAAVHALLPQGRTIMQIADELQLSRNIIRRFARAAGPDLLLLHGGTGKRTKDLQAYDAYLRPRWEQAAPTPNSSTQKYVNADTAAPSPRSGNISSPGGPAGPHGPRPPTFRQATAWSLSNPAHLDPSDRHRLNTLCDASPQLAVLRDRVRELAEMMVHRQGRRLETWMTTVVHDGLPELHSFVTGLRRDGRHGRAHPALQLMNGSSNSAPTKRVLTAPRRRLARSVADRTAAARPGHLYASALVARDNLSPDHRSLRGRSSVCLARRTSSTPSNRCRASIYASVQRRSSHPGLAESWRDQGVNHCLSSSTRSSCSV
ncbi:transposase [Actinomadura sp. WMMA1423]|uniref:transposase n=1 Tax=Actinomadura sp. WMMA1423 TaxID=2591108 RepID=UPI0011462C73|nr:transposase [Actinomadura sp. WMMA1423]